MDWDQIEQKWDEMTRRIQPLPTRRSTSRAELSRNEHDPSPANVAANSPGKTAKLVAAEPAV